MNVDFSEWILTDWLNYLENRLPKEIDLGLEKVKLVAEKLGLLHYNIPVILVAGTNGKGSCVAALEAIYMASGYKVGCYISPHLFVFNERITVNKQHISDLELCKIFTTIERASDNVQLTYFEMTTLAGLLYFKQSHLDVIILEVGMGGRLDATNIIDADIGIVTTIDFDHQAYLGNTLDEIGYEKAGIFRPKQLCIYADCNPPQSILQRAYEIGSELYCLNIDYSFTEVDNQLILKSHLFAQNLKLPLPNIHLNSAAAAVMVSQLLLDKLPINYQALIDAMQNVCLLGRKQIDYSSVTTIYDVAHNPQAATSLAVLIDNMISYVPDDLKQDNHKVAVRAVFSALGDKDLRSIIRTMMPLVDYWYPCLINNKRASSELLISDAFRAEMCEFKQIVRDPVVAYKLALEESNVGDIIVVFGSFLVVGSVMSSKREVLI